MNTCHHDQIIFQILIIRFKLVGLGGATFKLLAINCCAKTYYGRDFLLCISWSQLIVKNKNKILFQSFPLMWTYFDTHNFKHPYLSF